MTDAILLPASLPLLLMVGTDCFYRMLRVLTKDYIRNIAEQSSEDRPPLVEITDHIYYKAKFWHTRKRHINENNKFQSKKIIFWRDSPDGYHRKHILKPNKVYLGALIKGTSPRINSNPNKLYFRATHQPDITENIF